MAENNLLLATLSNHLNLNRSRYNLILNCYPSIKDAVDDKFKLFLSQLSKFSKPSNTVRNSKHPLTQLNSIEHSTDLTDLFDIASTYQSQTYKTSKNLETSEPVFEVDLDNYFMDHKYESRWLAKIQHFQWHDLDELQDRLQIDLESSSVKILSFEQFPESVLSLDDCPVVLYFQGDLTAFHCKKSISIVGSRNINNYSTKILNNLIPQLESLNLSIVSGLALGVDSLAHQLALKHKLKCLAFIGSGHHPNVFYPSRNLKLKDEIIASGGLICSEYPPYFKSMPFTFPRRNRLVANTSNLTWIVQADLNSGAMITAKNALDLGKIVCSTPASIFDTDFNGNLKLIKEGAQIISNIDDLLGLLDLVSSIPDRSNKSKLIKTDTLNWDNFSPQAKTIYTHLSFEAKEIQDLFLATNIPISSLSTELSLMELQGIVENIGQNKWIKS